MRNVRAFGRWLLVPVMLIASTMAAWIAFWFSIALEQATLTRVASAHLNFPPSDLLHIADLFTMILILAIWIFPVAWAIGFAIRTHAAVALIWGFSASLLLAAAFVWFRTQPLSGAFAIIAAVLVITGICLLAVRRLRVRMALLFEAASFLLLFIPALLVLAMGQKQPPAAQNVWSVVLQKGMWQAMNTGSEFGATRRLAFAGDRIVVVFNAGSAGYKGKEPMSEYRALSLNCKSGIIENQMEFTGPWGAMPYVYGTGHGRIVLVGSGPAELLNPDLSKTGITANIKGRVTAISPDGSTLAVETAPGTTFLNADTLQPVARLSESAPGSISRSAALSEQVSWDPLKREEFFFLEDAVGHRRTLLFQGNCGYPAQFLNSDKLLVTGCGKIYILNTKGNVVAENASAGTGRFAGVSQNGKRFALEFSDERGDSSVLLYERFVIYDSATASPVSSVLMDSLPERQSWSAFSPDGRYFAVGNPNKLTLYSMY